MSAFRWIATVFQDPPGAFINVISGDVETPSLICRFSTLPPQVVLVMTIAFERS